MKKQILFVVLLLQVSHMMSFIFSYYHLTKGSKQVFLLGDMHIGSRSDNFEKDLILKMMNKSSDFAERVVFICEANRQYMDATGRDKDDLEAFYPMLGAIRELYHVAPAKYDSAKFKFIYGDMRKISMMNAFAKKYDYVDFDILKADVIETIHTIVDKATSLPHHVSDFVKSLLPDDFIDNFYFNADLTDVHKDINKKNINLLTDLGFYVQIEKALMANNKVILYAGAAHNQRVLTWLTTQGFIIEDSKTHDLRILEQASLIMDPQKLFRDIYSVSHKVTILADEDWEKVFGMSLPATGDGFFIVGG